jgi:hypothetical protein
LRWHRDDCVAWATDSKPIELLLRHARLLKYLAECAKRNVASVNRDERKPPVTVTKEQV